MGLKLLKDETRELVSSLCCELCDGSHLSTRNLALTRHQIFGHLDLGLPASRTVRDKHVLSGPRVCGDLY